MAMDCRVFVHFEALATLPKAGKRRAAVIGHLQILGQIAHLGGDYEVNDPEIGRPFNVTEVGGYAITWWIDVPVGEVKVIDITSANSLGQQEEQGNRASSAILFSLPSVEPVDCLGGSARLPVLRRGQKYILHRCHHVSIL